MELIELLKIAKISDTTKFNDGKILDVSLYNAKSNKPYYEIKLHLKDFIPVELYIALVEGLKNALKASIALYLEIENQTMDSKKIQEYINQYIELKENNLPQLQFLKEQTLVVRNNTIRLSYDSMLKENILKEIQPKLQKFLNAAGFNLKIEFVFVEPDGVKFNYEEDLQEIFSKQIVVEPTYNNSNEKFRYRGFKKRRLNINFRGKTFIPTALELIGDNADILTQGKVFEVKPVDSEKVIYRIYITNNKASFITLIEKSQKYPSSLFESLIGKWIEITGTYAYDSYEKENVIYLNTLDVIDNKDEVILDTAPVKRVELHAHTDMSAMDGISSVEELVAQAAAYGHPAIAITDHNSVQSFPNAQKIQKELKKQGKEIKIIYGLETNVVNSKLDTIKNPSDVSLLDATYVAFDIETTGLSSQFDTIIEFGAIKFKNNQEIDALDILINPGFKLSEFTKSLTHITDDLLQNQPTLNQVLPKIKKFIDGCVLIAHNATFDVGFIEAALGYPLDNPIIDTLSLSRALNPEESKHNLGAVARRSFVDYNEESAHRADYDADVLRQVYDILLSKAMEDERIRCHKDLDLLQSDAAIKRTRSYHMNILVKNQSGLKDLFKLVSVANTAYFSETPLIPKSVVDQYRKDFLIGSSCARGEIFEIASTKTINELKEIMKFYDYIEIQPIDQYELLVETNKVESMEKVNKILRNIITAANELKLPIVATGDVHYTYKYQAIAREILIATPANGGGFHPLYDYQKRVQQYPIQDLKTTDEMMTLFPYLTEEEAYQYIVENPNKIASQIDIVLPIHDRLYPPFLENSDEELRHICYENAHKMYGENLPDIVSNRLEKELNSIISNGYSVIYLIANKTVLKSMEDGFLVGSRGSVGSSFVATCAGITEVNPLRPHYRCPHCGYSDFNIDETKVKSGFDLPTIDCPICHQPMLGDGHNIPFETFLGFKGDKVPDIDLNFSGKNQDQAHSFIRELFGKDKVFRAGTISTAASKTAFGYAKRYYEKKEIEISNAEACRIAKMIEGTKKTTGQHPGGLIVIPADMEVYDFTPIQYPADDVSSDWFTTHFAFEYIHDNVLKLDMLGHVDPTALRMLQNLTGVDPRTIPMNDKNVLSQFTGGTALELDRLGAAGLPEFGTKIARRMLSETNPKSFSELVQICGLSHGTDVWFGNARELIKNKTCELMNVIGCRDDVMVNLLEYGLEPIDAFSIMENVRKATKNLTPDQEKIMLDHHVPQWYIDSCKKIHYMFPKAHAVAYTMMAVRVAWYKYYKPLEYYATYFSTRCDTYDIVSMIQGEDAVRMKYDELLQDQNEKSNKDNDLLVLYEIVLEMFKRGYKFANIDLEKSMDEDFICDYENNLLIPPFKTIDGLGIQAAKSVVKARNEQPFISKQDLMRRTKLNSTNIRFLEKIGALKFLDEVDQLTLF